MTWTPEQLNNVLCYGLCVTCGSPREPKILHTNEEFWTDLVCPNGCGQDTWAEFDYTPLLDDA